jgi:hypothetical protein
VVGPAARGVVDARKRSRLEKNVMKKKREAEEHKSRLRAQRKIAAVRSRARRKISKGGTVLVGSHARDF